MPWSTHGRNALAALALVSTVVASCARATEIPQGTDAGSRDALPGDIDAGERDAPDPPLHDATADVDHGTDGGEAASDGGADAGMGPAAPRPLAPLSTATVTSRHPALRWALAPDTDGATVELCADRACASVITTLDVVGTTTSLAPDLPAGLVYWRLFGRRAGEVGTASSAVWEFFVGHRSAPIDTSWGGGLDSNGDGYVDMAVGAEGAVSNAGRAYVYLGSASGLDTSSVITISGPDGSDAHFGHAVANAGDINGDGYGDVIVGAFGAALWAGRAHVFLGGPAGIDADAPLTLDSPDDGGEFGMSVAGLGDVDGDGYADVAIGAAGALSSTGRVYVYRGGPSGPTAIAATTLTGPDGVGGSFGCSVSGVGDVNGDGFGDLAVGAYGALAYTGRVYVYLGGPSGIDASGFLTLTGPETGGSFGLGLGSAGDVNGDGYADLGVGAHGDHSAVAPRAHVYLGSAVGVAAAPTTTLVGAWVSFGWSVASAGDVDGDGYGDFAVGAPAAIGYSGAVYLYLGGVSGLATTESFMLAGPDHSSGRFGRSVSAGDINGDGFSDLAVGAEGVLSNAGSAYVYPGNSSGLQAAPTLTLSGPDGADGLFGMAVAAGAL